MQFHACRAPTQCHSNRAKATRRTASLLSGAHQTLAEPVDEFAIRFREPIEKAVDRTHDDAPLGLTGDCTHRVEAALEFVRNANTELRIITNLLSVAGSGRWASCTTAANRASHAEPFCKSNSNPEDRKLALRLHYLSGVSAPASTDRYTDRNHEQAARVLTPRGAERRRHSRSGRRSDDPHVSEWHWRRVAFLFGAYVTLVGLRSLPQTVQRWFERSRRL